MNSSDYVNKLELILHRVELPIISAGVVPATRNSNALLVPLLGHWHFGADGAVVVVVVVVVCSTPPSRCSLKVAFGWRMSYRNSGIMGTE